MVNTGGCYQTVPESLICGFEGTAIMAGAGAWHTLHGPVSAYGSLLGGPYRSRFLSGTTPALEADAGSRVRLGRRFDVRAGGRYMKAFNTEFKRLLGRDQHYFFWDLGAEIGVF